MFIYDELSRDSGLLLFTTHWMLSMPTSREGGGTDLVSIDADNLCNPQIIADQNA
jgi:hypothetical protein